MVISGLDNLIASDKKFINLNSAIIANHTSVTSNLIYSWDVLLKKGFNLKRIFSPEHGLFATEQDQIPAGSHSGYPAEIISLYGNSNSTLFPDEKYLSDLDIVFFDIQDVGARYYTYLNTMIYFMRKISGRKIKFAVLDRPNPLGGEKVEGPVLNMKFESFVGALPVCVRHGFTAGETALMAKDFYNNDIDLHVIKMKNWRRGMFYDKTGLTWISPSPNMPTLNTALVYPGLCLIEGTNLSEGRGTTTPFETSGADFIDSNKYSDYLNSINLPGAYFRPVLFKPVFGKFSGKTCSGIFIHITDRKKFSSFKTGLAVIHAAKKLTGKLIFRTDEYEFNNTIPAFDLLCGNSDLRNMIETEVSLEIIFDSFQEDESKYSKDKKDYHIY